jgi:membrane fusion protein (multidrug efflux system)
MFVRGEIMLGNEVGAYLLPQRAVSRNAKGQAFAYFVDSDNRVETRLLKAERAYKTNWVVSKGVSPGDRLIVEGMQHVAKGDEVIALPAKVTELGLVELLPTGVPVAVLESTVPKSVEGAVLSTPATADGAVKVDG